MSRKPVTDEDVDRFIDFMGIKLLPFQRELFMKIVNHEGDIFFIPRRCDGHTDLRMLLELAAILFEDWKKGQQK